MKSRLLAAIVAGVALAVFSAAPLAQTARDSGSTEAKKPSAVDAAKARKAAASKPQTEAAKAVEPQGTKPASLRKSPAYDGAGGDCHHSAKESDA